LLEAAEREEVGVDAGLELDEQVDIAVGSEVGAEGGAEDADGADADARQMDSIARASTCRLEIEETMARSPGRIVASGSESCRGMS
jgi:hypothetical protein